MESGCRGHVPAGGSSPRPSQLCEDRRRTQPACQAALTLPVCVSCPCPRAHKPTCSVGGGQKVGYACRLFQPTSAGGTLPWQFSEGGLWRAELFISHPAPFATFNTAQTRSKPLSLGCLLYPGFERLPPGHETTDIAALLWWGPAGEDCQEVANTHACS